MLRLVLTLIAITALPTAALAQTSPSRPVVVFDMDADVIEGVSLDVPDVPFVGHRPKPAHKNLIQVRKSFSQELLASASKI